MFGIAGMIVNFAATVIRFGVFRRKLDAFRKRFDSGVPIALILRRDAADKVSVRVLCVEFQRFVAVRDRLREIFVRFFGFGGSGLHVAVGRGGLRQTIPFFGDRQGSGGATEISVDGVRVGGDRFAKGVVSARPLSDVQRGDSGVDRPSRRRLRSVAVVRIFAALTFVATAATRDRQRRRRSDRPKKSLHLSRPS